MQRNVKQRGVFGPERSSPSPRRRMTAVVASATLVAATLVAMAAAPPAYAAAASPSPFDVPAGVGATVPFTQYEAEQASTNGELVGPDDTQGTVASEASGRRAVRLASQGQYVEFTLTGSANAVTVAYNLPQGASGSLSIYLDGVKPSQKLSLTSKFMYLDTPWIPGAKTHHLFTHDRLRFGSTLAAGTKVRLQVDAGDVSGAVIDTADFENVPAPATQPANSVSVTDKGADPTGVGDSTNAFNQTIAAARSAGSTVWIPPGDFKITSPLQIDSVTMRGAGPWYSALRGTHLIDNTSTQGAIKLYDFAAIGEVTTRNDSSPDNFVNGSLGNGSVVSNIWIQHQKVGLWLVGPNNSNLTIENSRFLDLTADGVNFNGTVTNSVVRNNYLRNTGDDSLAMWSLHSENASNTFSNNTVVQPNLANGIAIYGGRDTTLSNNVVADTNALGSGIAISNQEFIAGQGFTPLAGTITVSGNTIIRGGAMNPNWGHPMSAIRFDAYDYAFTNVTVNFTGGQIVDSPWSAIQMVGGAGTGMAVNGLNVNGVTVTNVGTVVMQAETQGSGSFSNVAATGIGVAGIYDCSYPPGTPDFTFNLGTGNTGWPDSKWPGCDFPDRVNPGDLKVSPTSVDFGSQDVGTTSASKAVTITNSDTKAVSIQGITATGDFAQTNNCGTSLAAGTSCTVQVTFKPTVAGARTGTLTITSSAPNSPTTVTLTGTGFDPAGNLALGRPVSASSSLASFPASNAVDGNANSYWESANNAFPQWLTVDLGAVRTVGRVVLKLPPDPAWAARTQTLSVSGSTDGSAYSTIVASTGYRFDPATGNTVTINFAQTDRRFLRLTFTDNTGWPAAQVSEFEVYSASDTTPPPPPTGNLALNKATSESSHTQVLVSANAVDGDSNTYWESANDAFPQWLQVDLGSATSVSRIVVALPPDPAWETRTQTLSVSGSTDGSSFTAIVGSTGYTFDPATGNTVTITFNAASTRYLRLTFTANTGWPAGQVSEFEVFAP